MSDEYGQLLDDLEAEQGWLRSVLDGADLGAPTPAAGWAVRDQVFHLGFFDGEAGLAIRDPDAFLARRDALLAAGAPLDPPPTDDELVGWWDAGRQALTAALRPLDAGARLPWYGPTMSARSFVTARLMECWAHGQDVADGLGADHERADRVRHVCHIGVITRGWSYAVRRTELPEAEVRVELALPSGATAAWGAEDAGESITGDAWDFALVVTQRRNVADTGLIVVGEAAASWMQVAQAFAGGPTLGPPPAA